MKVKVNWDLCENNARCTRAAPQIFRMDDQDMLQILVEDVPEGLKKQLEMAVKACPKAAISIEP